MIPASQSVERIDTLSPQSLHPLSSVASMRDANFKTATAHMAGNECTLGRHR